MVKQDRSISAQAETEINWEALEQYIRKELRNLPEKPMVIKQFSAGYSNLTFLIQVGNWEAVLRRPPFGQIPPKAHDMQREYTILEKVNPVFPLAPKPFLYHEDPVIMDKHFYLMEQKKGIVLDDTIPPEYEKIENVGRHVSEAVVDTIVKLHTIDYQKAGLEKIGRPEGYLERQVHGWIKRYRNSETDDLKIVTEIEKWLVDHIPRSPKPTIVHNDLKLNNMMLDPANPSSSVAVFDWEMCTIGDPLTDLGSTLAYWKEEGEPYTGLTAVTNLPGFMKRTELIQSYAEKSGRDVSSIDFYIAFSFFKIAAILQQIYYRYKLGYLNDDRFEDLHVGIENLLLQSHEALHSSLL